MSDTVYEKVYSPAQEARLTRLCPSGRHCLMYVLAAMQTAEIIGGPEGEEYLTLMEAIVEEATERRDYCRDHIMD